MSNTQNQLSLNGQSPQPFPSQNFCDFNGSIITFEIIYNNHQENQYNIQRNSQQNQSLLQNRNKLGTQQHKDRHSIIGHSSENNQKNLQTRESQYTPLNLIYKEQQFNLQQFNLEEQNGQEYQIGSNDYESDNNQSYQDQQYDNNSRQNIHFQTYPENQENSWNSLWQQDNFLSMEQPQQYGQHQELEQHSEQQQQIQQEQLVKKRTRKKKKNQTIQLNIDNKTKKTKNTKNITINNKKIRKQENPKSKSKSKSKKITEKNLKIQKRIEQRNINERLVNARYEEKIKEHIENDPYFKLPNRINKDTINQITQNISRIKNEIYQKFGPKIDETWYKKEMEYIIEIIMLIVKYINYTKIGSNPNIYMLKEIQWINKMRDDHQDAFQKPKVQKALEYIYRFILNNEDGQQRFEKIAWKDLVEKQQYLGQQLEYGKKFFTSLGRNYRQYIDDKKLVDTKDLDKNLYDLGAQQNTHIKKIEFFCEKYDRRGIKYFVVNQYMEYFLNNRYNVTNRIEEIYLDDLINLIISTF